MAGVRGDGECCKIIRSRDQTLQRNMISAGEPGILGDAPQSPIMHSNWSPCVPDRPQSKHGNTVREEQLSAAVSVLPSSQTGRVG